MPVISPQQAIDKLSRGELVALPTETVYGLAGRIDRDETLRSIFSVKGRPFFDPLIVHVADLETARSLTLSWPEIYDKLAGRFWPGPLTLIAPKNSKVSSLITSGLDSVALRSPNHPTTIEILKRVGIPLAAPSANRFGQTSPTTANHVIQEFGDRVDVVDGGPCSVGVESTVVSATETGEGGWKVDILRPGGVSRQSLMKFFAEEEIDAQVERRVSQVSPGHLKHHYQPKSPLALVPSGLTEAEILANIQRLGGAKLNKVNWLRLDRDPNLAARALYQAFRDLSAEGAAIACEVESHLGEESWEAILDRLERAATFNWATFKVQI